ncbi:hypothetical protein CHARACLAT_015639 [Characodon lateralis]|uniref:G-protein coupled receptors family 2 profile 1 domain-containing protein n=1 Tax=Characodon lateralis TaxID=208331 RepID=A0ABU7F3V1_9TELE|nr:hypothetical protein [Characodon lateralis]
MKRKKEKHERVKGGAKRKRERRRKEWRRERRLKRIQDNTLLASTPAETFILPAFLPKSARAIPNQDTDIEHMPPNPYTMNALPTAQGQTPTGELHPRKADKATPTQRKLHTQPCSKHPRRVPPPPHSVPQRQSKGPAQRHPSLRPQAQRGTFTQKLMKVVCVCVLLSGRVSSVELTCETLILLSTNLTARMLVLLNQTFIISNSSGVYCDISVDGIGTCWPRSAAGELISRPCPEQFNGIHYNTTSKYLKSTGRELHCAIQFSTVPHST